MAWGKEKLEDTEIMARMLGAYDDSKADAPDEGAKVDGDVTDLQSVRKSHERLLEGMRRRKAKLCR